MEIATNKTRKITIAISPTFDDGIELESENVFIKVLKMQIAGFETTN